MVTGITSREFQQQLELAFLAGRGKITTLGEQGMGMEPWAPTTLDWTQAREYSAAVIKQFLPHFI